MHYGDREDNYVAQLLKKRPDLDNDDFKYFALRRCKYSKRSIYNIGRDEIDRLTMLWDKCNGKMQEMRKATKLQKWANRLNEINIKFGIPEDKLQDYVNTLHNALLKLDKEKVDQIGHDEYVEKSEYEETDPLKMAQKKMKNRETFITHSN